MKLLRNEATFRSIISAPSCSLRNQYLAMIRLRLLISKIITHHFGGLSVNHSCYYKYYDDSNNSSHKKR